MYDRISEIAQSVVDKIIAGMGVAAMKYDLSLAVSASMFRQNRSCQNIYIERF